MANAKPIVAARASAVPETVAEGEIGILADPNDPDAFAEGLAALLADRGLRRLMGEAGRLRVEAYRADRVAGLFLERVQTALAGCGLLIHRLRRLADFRGTEKLLKRTRLGE